MKYITKKYLPILNYPPYSNVKEVIVTIETSEPTMKQQFASFLISVYERLQYALERVFRNRNKPKSFWDL